MRLFGSLRRVSPALLVGSQLLASCVNTSDKSTSPPSLASAAPPSPAVASLAVVPEDAGRRATLGYSRALKLMTRLRQSCAPVTNDRIWRFIEGLDECPRPLTDAEQQDELNDPWGAGVLRQRTFPTSVDTVVQAIVASAGALAGGQRNYLVGEGSQVPLSVAPRTASRSLRYVLTWNGSDGNADILLSALPGGSSSFLQLISWDAKKNSYNFYEYSVDRRGWSWAGDSRFARRKETVGQGCFDCHHNGTAIMKELTVPWNNWHSILATIDPSVVPEAVAAEPFFRNLTGAEVLESSVRGGFQRYHNLRLRGLLQRQPDGSFQISQVPELLRHVISQSTINFASTQIQSDPARATDPKAPISGLPSDFFLRDSVLKSAIGLQYEFPTKLEFDRSAFDSYLKVHGFELVQDRGQPKYRAPGGTFFAFFVPVQPAEDVFVTKQLLANKLVSDKFVASVHMVDFPNPVFSAVRDALLRYAEQLPTGTLKAGQSDVPARFAALLAREAERQPPCDPAKLEQCTAEQQFLFFWNQPDTEWRAEATKRLQAYLDAIGRRLGAPQGLDDYMRLAVSRGTQFSQWPLIGNLDEFSLLLPSTNIPAAPLLRMRHDGTVAPVSAPTHAP